MMHKPNTRAIRRHHAHRMLMHARHIIAEVWRAGYGANLSDQEVAREARRFRDNMQACSCDMCGNPRRRWGKRTLQERRLELAEEADCIDL